MPYSICVNSGDSLVFSCNSTVASVITGAQFELTNVTVNLRNVTINPEPPLMDITNPVTLNANYTDSFQMTITQSDITSEAGSNMVLTVGAANYSYMIYPLLFGLKKKPRLSEHLRFVEVLENNFL